MSLGLVTPSGRSGSIVPHLSEAALGTLSAALLSGALLKRDDAGGNPRLWHLHELLRADPVREMRETFLPCAAFVDARVLL